MVKVKQLHNANAVNQLCLPRTKSEVTAAAVAAAATETASLSVITTICSRSELQAVRCF